MDAGISVGVAGGGAPGRVDPVGVLAPPRGSWQLEWWVGADDRWRVPANEVAVRQHRVGDAPVVETAMRVPGGDARHRVYGVAGGGNPLVIEIENASPAPFVVALVVRNASRVALEGPAAAIDTAFVLRTARAPSRWAKTVGGPVLLPVSTGAAVEGPFPSARDRGGRLEVAFLHPVAHRTTLRAVLTSTRDAPTLDPRAMPGADAVARGWSALLDRGLRVELPDRALHARVQAARAEVLLRAQARAAGATTTAALEDWGFDAEFDAVWRRLGARDRGRAAARPDPGTWATARALADDADLLVAVRRLLADDRRDPGAPIALCHDWPDAWRGQALEVRDAPVVGGRCSFAVRWHGPRAALLWDAPEGVVLTAPGLDSDWSTTEARGEVLLGPADATR